MKTSAGIVSSDYVTVMLHPEKVMVFHRGLKLNDKEDYR